MSVGVWLDVEGGRSLNLAVSGRKRCDHTAAISRPTHSPKDVVARLLWGDADKAGGDTLDIRAHAEALVEVKALLQVLDALGGVAGGKVVADDAFERVGLFGGCVKFTGHGLVMARA